MNNSSNSTNEYVYNYYCSIIFSYYVYYYYCSYNYDHYYLI